MLILQENNCLVESFKVGEMRTNTYLVVEPQSEEVMIIDPGEDGDFISDELWRRGWTKVKYLVITHGHFDHVGGLLSLKLNFAQAEILLHEKDKNLYNKTGESAKYWQGKEIDPPPKIDNYLTTGQKIKLGKKLEFEIIETPGHTMGSISLYSAKPMIVFTGDTLFAEGIVGRTDLKCSDQKKLLDSIKKLLKLPEETLVLPGHGKISAIKWEKKFHSQDQGNLKLN